LIKKLEWSEFSVGCRLETPCYTAKLLLRFFNYALSFVHLFINNSSYNCTDLFRNFYQTCLHFPLIFSKTGKVLERNLRYIIELVSLITDILNYCCIRLILSPTSGIHCIFEYDMQQVYLIFFFKLPVGNLDHWI